jgi:methylenetetrahydrofolate--tRNA-(uracil-5-)-methyltransferase
MPSACSTRRCGCWIRSSCARPTCIASPAGSALAVDRDGFAAEVTREIEGHAKITIVRERIDALPDHPTIIATGPLTGSDLAAAIASETGSDALAFFDAIAPIIHRDSVDMDICWMAARWDKGGKDYINCPMTRSSTTPSSPR